jgi:hypothetical protein
MSLSPFILSDPNLLGTDHAAQGDGDLLMVGDLDNDGVQDVVFAFERIVWIHRVVAPTISKSFSPTAVQAGGTSLVTVTLSNSNTLDLTGSAFTETLVNMSTVAGSVGGTCAGTSPGSFTAGQNSLSF